MDSVHTAIRVIIVSFIRLHSTAQQSEILITSKSIPLQFIFAYTRRHHWDSNTIGHKIKLDGNLVTLSAADEIDNSAFLIGKVDTKQKQVVHWTFRIEKCNPTYHECYIGLCPTKNRDFDQLKNTWFFCDDKCYAFSACQGVIRKYDCCDEIRYGKIGGKEVEMVLDCNIMELKYIVDGVDYGKAYDVKPGVYRVGKLLARRLSNAPNVKLTYSTCKANGTNPL
eukprot:358545_1